MNENVEKYNSINPNILELVIKGFTSGLNFTQLKLYLDKELPKIKVEVLPEQEIGIYLLAAHEYFYKKSVIDPILEKGIAFERLNNLYMNCFKIQDYKTCFQIQKEINIIINELEKPTDRPRPNLNDNKETIFNKKLDLSGIKKHE